MVNQDLINRLAKIEGQIKGIAKMVEQGACCEDVLIQISAASAALDRVAAKAMEEHIRHCVCDGIDCGNHKQLEDNLLSAFERYSKMK
ncbi:MAG: metal-sensitive transcriptional regulator [Clostridia bacterium]|nr:metal-sensitive transcriptional regulator [Clostridia bacterium]